MPPAHLLERLFASRFLVSHAQASVGVGDRRSPFTGAGLEFAEHRAYQQGDDVRRLDVRLLARLGENYVRLYSVDRQLPITVILDASPSMRYGSPDKFGFAALVCQLLGFVGLVGGEQIRMGAAIGGRLRWSPRFSGPNRAHALFEWIDRLEPADGERFGAVLREARPALRRKGLVFLVSDWWDEDVDAVLDALAADGQEIVAIHVAAPEEIDPAALGSGSQVMVDAETGEELELVLDSSAVRRYRAAFAEWTAALKRSFTRRQGRYFLVSTATSVQDFFLKDLRAAGIIT